MATLESEAGLRSGASEAGGVTVAAH
jgi:hypothetical protein